MLTLSILRAEPWYKPSFSVNSITGLLYSSTNFAATIPTKPPFQFLSDKTITLPVLCVAVSFALALFSSFSHSDWRATLYSFSLLQ